MANRTSRYGRCQLLHEAGRQTFASAARTFKHAFIHLHLALRQRCRAGPQLLQLMLQPEDLGTPSGAGAVKHSSEASECHRHWRRAKVATHCTYALSKRMSQKATAFLPAGERRQGRQSHAEPPTCRAHASAFAAFSPSRADCAHKAWPASEGRLMNLKECTESRAEPMLTR